MLYSDKTEIENSQIDTGMSNIISGVFKGDNRSIAKAISIIEDETEESGEIIRKIYSHTGKSFSIGVTGPPGTGKSTLVDKMVSEYRKMGFSVGVLAVDPSSPFSGGALLGDRVRMIHHSIDSGVFIRSMATRDNSGSLARAVKNTLRILDASGKDVIILETVGIGQSEVEVMNVVDATVVVLMPHIGDEVQIAKAGIMEIGDIFVVNKADLDGSDRAQHNIMASSFKKGGWKPLVIKTVATTGEGVAELIESLSKLRKFLMVSGSMDILMRERIEKEILDKVLTSHIEDVRKEIKKDEELKKLVNQTLAKEIDPETASRKLSEKFSVIVENNE